jgi:hypothetical protein
MTFTINGVAVATPKTFKVTVVDLDSDNTQRNALGVLLRDRLRVMRTIDCEWGPLSSSDISTILQALEPVEFPVTFPDPYTGTDQTITMYVGDRPAIALDFSSGMWLGLSLKLTEI